MHVTSKSCSKTVKNVPSLPSMDLAVSEPWSLVPFCFAGAFVKLHAAPWLVLQDNVALIAVLEALDPPQSEGANRRQLICIANTHIHANPELNDVKLWQVQLLSVFMRLMHGKSVTCTWQAQPRFSF